MTIGLVWIEDSCLASVSFALDGSCSVTKRLWCIIWGMVLFLDYHIYPKYSDMIYLLTIFLQNFKTPFDCLVIRVILELSNREKFCNNFRISGRSFDPNFGFPYTFYTFSLLPQLKIERSASLGRLFLLNFPLGWPLVMYVTSGTWMKNYVDPDQMLHSAVSGVHMLRPILWIFWVNLLVFFLLILVCTASICYI